jgi:hypothetical protein
LSGNGAGQTIGIYEMQTEEAALAIPRKTWL